MGSTVAQNADKAVVIVGGGYDTVHDTSAYNTDPDQVGTGIHMLDLVSGQRLWSAGAATSSANLRLANMNRAIPSAVRVIDLNGDSFADRMYAADLGGQLWRFDIANGKAPSSLVAGGVIAQLGGDGASGATTQSTRRFYTTPDVSLVTDRYAQRKFLAISIGSGYRAHPFDLSADDRFYSVRDLDVFNRLTPTEYSNYDVVVESDLVEVSGRTEVTIAGTARGWKFTLPPGEKVIADSVTFNDEVFFVSFAPDTSAAAACASGYGRNTLYRVSVLNGDPTVPNLEVLAGDDVDDARRSILQQGGIAPSPVFLFPPPSDDCTGASCISQPIGCIGGECFDPGFANNPVRTLWTQDGVK